MYLVEFKHNMLSQIREILDRRKEAVEQLERAIDLGCPLLCVQIVFELIAGPDSVLRQLHNAEVPKTSSYKWFDSPETMRKNADRLITAIGAPFCSYEIAPRPGDSARARLHAWVYEYGERSGLVPVAPLDPVQTP